MKLSIDQAVLEKYPEVQIGFLVAKVSIRKSDPFVENLKEGLGKSLEDLGIQATNYTIHPSISLWRKIYEEDFLVKAKTFPSSIEALVKRVVRGSGLWNICNVVDLYNCCSIYSMLPMGGYDLSKVSGNIQVRYAKEEEPFLALGTRDKISTKSNQVVYADDKRVICWLWNHKDSKETCIDENSEYVVFFIDSFEISRVQAALKQLAESLEKIQCCPLESGILNKLSSQTHLQLSIPICS